MRKPSLKKILTQWQEYMGISDTPSAKIDEFVDRIFEGNSILMDSQIINPEQRINRCKGCPNVESVDRRLKCSLRHRFCVDILQCQGEVDGPPELEVPREIREGTYAPIEVDNIEEVPNMESMTSVVERLNQLRSQAISTPPPMLTRSVVPFGAGLNDVAEQRIPEISGVPLSANEYIRLTSIQERIRQEQQAGSISTTAAFSNAAAARSRRPWASYIHNFTVSTGEPNRE